MRFLLLLIVVGCVRSDDPCLYVSKYGIIDLTTLGRSDGKPQFLNVVPTSGSNYEYSYNPCKAFTQGHSCQNVSVCQTSLDGQIQFVLGTQDSAKWDDGTRAGVAPSVSYKAGERQVHISLVCTQSQDGDLFPFGEETPNTFSFILRHRCACWNGCSYVPPITTTTISTSTHMNTTAEHTTTTEKKTTTTTTATKTTPTLATTTLPLDTAHSSMHAHICLTIISILISFVLF